MALVEQLSPPPVVPALVGTWRRFGMVGPVYEIVGVDRRLEDGDWMMRIRVLESGEEADYKLSDVMADPEEG